jgi:hypothetical protein
MANFEEKILSYLDGSLSEADREDVLAKISGDHGSERALFDAHLRLQDLYSVVRKPVSAPLSLQRELASQIPVLAIKLPYLAAPAERRNRVGAGWFSSIRSSWVNVFLLLMLALLAGGVWYVMNDNAHRGIGLWNNGSSSSPSIAGASTMDGSSNAALGTATVENTSNNSGRTAQSIASPNVNVANANTLHFNANASNPPVSNVDRSITNTSGVNRVNSHTIAANNVRASHSNTSNSSQAISDNSNIAHARSNATNPSASRTTHSRVSSSTTDNGTPSSASSNAQNTVANQSNGSSTNIGTTTTTDVSLNNRSANSSSVTPLDNASTNSDHPTVVNPSANANPATPATSTAPDLPPLPLHAIDAAATQPIGFDPQHAMPIGYASGDNSTFTPLHVYASAGLRFLRPSSNLSSYVLNESKQGIIGTTIAPSYEATAEYEISPWTSAGVRIGQTSFAQYQSFTHSGSSSSPYYSQYLDIQVLAVPAFWSALALTQTFNPQDRTVFSLTLAGGPAFTAPVAWLGMIEASAAYDLSPSFVLRGGVSYDMAQVKQSLQSPNTSANSTTGFITASSGGVLTSSAIGVNLGISFHP